MIFNSSILLQVFNQFNATEMEKKNAFKDVHQNHWFWVATAALLALQVALSRFQLLLLTVQG